MVHAYPLLPDIMAVAAVVAAEEGDPEALSHLRADSSGGPGAFLQPRSPGRASHPATSSKNDPPLYCMLFYALWHAMGSSVVTDTHKG